MSEKISYIQKNLFKQLGLQIAYFSEKRKKKQPFSFCEIILSLPLSTNCRGSWLFPGT